MRKLVRALAPDGYLLLGPQDAVFDFGLPLTPCPRRAAYLRDPARPIVR